MVSSSGTKTAAYAYDPYGPTSIATGPNATPTPSATGGLCDTTTGYTKFGTRYYDPSTGRFTQPDPSGQEQNPYAYAGSNPATHSDPNGLDWGDAGVVIGGLAAGAATLAACSVPYIGWLGCAATGAVLGASGGITGGLLGSTFADEEVSESDVLWWGLAGAAGPTGAGIYAGLSGL